MQLRRPLPQSLFSIGWLPNAEPDTGSPRSMEPWSCRSPNAQPSLWFSCWVSKPFREPSIQSAASHAQSSLPMVLRMIWPWALLLLLNLKVDWVLPQISTGLDASTPKILFFSFSKWSLDGPFQNPWSGSSGSGSRALLSSPIAIGPWGHDIVEIAVISTWTLDRRLFSDLLQPVSSKVRQEPGSRLAVLQKAPTAPKDLVLILLGSLTGLSSYGPGTSGSDLGCGLLEVLRLLLPWSWRRSQSPERRTVCRTSWPDRVVDVDDIRGCQMGSYWMGSAERNTLGAECTKASRRRATDGWGPFSGSTSADWRSSCASSAKEDLHPTWRCSQAWGNCRMPRVSVYPWRQKGHGTTHRGLQSQNHRSDGKRWRWKTPDSR